MSAYTEECLPQMRERRVQLNTCPVTQTCATGLLIAPPKIGHHHYLHSFARSSADPGKVQNIQMAVFHKAVRSRVTFSVTPGLSDS